MIYIKTLYLLALLVFPFHSFCQTKNERLSTGRKFAEKELRVALKDKIGHNVIDNKKVIIKDSVTAVSVAEPILFSIYGKDNITKQRPYNIYFISNHWFVSGTLPEEYEGGTFLIIIDGRNSKILKITHGR
jgi:hypothetical protein